MRGRDLIAAGAVAAAAVVCCAAPALVAAIGAIGLTAGLAKVGNVLVPALILCAGLIGFGLYASNAANGRRWTITTSLVIGTDTAA
jgi:hypothetical protein